MAGRSVTITGATGLIGPRLTSTLLEAGWEVSVLSRDPARARQKLGEVEAYAWDLMSEPAPVEALSGRDAVVHLAGESVAQRWSRETKQAIGASRVVGTGNLIEGLGAADPRPGVLVSSSATGYYGPRGIEPLDEEAPAGDNFLAETCLAWEHAAERAGELQMRVVRVRTGVVLDRRGGALEKMLPPFQLGIGGPVAGGDQFIPWIHTADLVGIIIAALEDERWSGPVNGTAPTPVTNRDFSKALGRILHRPSFLPVPAVALQALYGEMAEIVTTGARVVPARPLMLGYEFRYPELEGALRSALSD